MSDVDPAVVRLVLPRAEHAPEWARWRQQPKARRHMPLRDASIEDLAKRLVAGAVALTDRAGREHRRMIAQGEAVVGTVAITNASWEMGYAELGYQIDEDRHGEGLGTLGVMAFVALVFRKTTLRRLIAVVTTDNEPSIRLLERLGFVREGLLRAHYLIEGEPRDHYAYGLLRREWRGI